MNFEFIATVAGYIVAIAGALGLLFKVAIAPHLTKKINEVFKEIKEQDGYMSKEEIENFIGAKIDEKFDANAKEILNPIKEIIEKQLRPNGGGSIVDRVPRIEKAIESMSESQTTLANSQAMSSAKIANIEGIVGQMDSNITLLLKAYLDSKR